MSRALPVLLLIAALLLPATAAGAGARHVATGPDTKPADPDYRHLPAVFDCSAAVDTLILAAAGVDTLRGDTTGAPRQNPSYSCAPWNEPGPEHVYRLVVETPLEVTAALREVDDSLDHDLFLLNACDTDACLIGVNTEFSALLDPGEYWLVIDSTNRAPLIEGPYTVAIEVREPGIPQAACTEAAQQAWDCDAAGQVVSVDLFGKPDLVRSYDCAASFFTGGESWHEVVLPPYTNLRLEADTQTLQLDPALWIFDVCGPEAVCLGHANDNAGGLPEKLELENASGEFRTVLVAVDCFRAPEDEASGTVTVTRICEALVPAERTPFGSFKSLYR
jgi:hypothetical protein